MWTKLHFLLFLTIFTKRIYVCFCYILFYVAIEVYKVYKATTLGSAFIFSLRFAIKSSVTKYTSSHFYRMISAALEGYQTTFEFINSASKVNQLSKTHNILDRKFNLVLPMNIQDWFPLGWTVWSLCSPRESQESSPTPQSKSISSSELRLTWL